VSVAGGYAYIADQEGGLAVAAFYVRGDLNCDGFVDLADINPFIRALIDKSSYEAAFPLCHHANADCNNDGAVNLGDVNPFVALLTGSQR
jgi:hypothetical protein